MIQEMYKDVYTKVRSCVGETEGFQIRVGLHQGSALSPFIFNIVMDVMTEEVRAAVPWNVFHADDIVLCGERTEDLGIKLEEWRTALEERGMKICRSKTEYMCTTTKNENGESIRMNGEEIKKSKQL